MDVTFNNVLEGTRQYFMGLPSQTSGPGQPVWQQPPEEGAPAQSGAPAPSSRPPSTAAAPATPGPPRPPSEPEEPEPHIIHKATVMREALEKRREQPEPDDEADDASSPPSHIICKPPHALPSPCESPARPPSAPRPMVAPPTSAPESVAVSDAAGYRHSYRPTPSPAVRQQEHYAVGRPADPYPGSRPPENVYPRYHYEGSDNGRNIHTLSTNSPQPSHARQSPQQTYARISSSMPQHTSAARLREIAAQSPPTQRYNVATIPPPPHNDRVPPIHHPAPTTPQRPVQPDSRTLYAPQHRVAAEPLPYSRTPTHYDRHSTITPRKYDLQQAYPGYRPVATQPLQNHVDAQPPPSQLIYKQSIIDAAANTSTLYSRPPERARPPEQTRPLDSARLPPRPEYANMSRVVEDATARNIIRGNYQYATPSTSTARYSQSASVPVPQNPAMPQRNIERNATYRPAQITAKPSYEYHQPSQSSPARGQSTKNNLANQQARMTVSVTSLVNQMNQTKQKRESPLDLSVKTVKNSADSSTMQEDADSSCVELKTVPIQQRPTPVSRQPAPVNQGYVTSHKVDFAPDFQSQYRERNKTVHGAVAPVNPPTRYNGGYEVRQPLDAYPTESRHQSYIGNNTKYSGARHEYTVPRIDLTRTAMDDRTSDSRMRNDKRFSHDEARKRVTGPIVNNIPEKIMRYETWSADSRIDRVNLISAREQQELMKRPVYSYSSHKRLEAFHNEQKRPAAPTAYQDSRYPYLTEPAHRDAADYHNHYYDKHHPTNGRNVIQKIPNTHHLDNHNGVPANKHVLSILRNSLETKHTGFVEPARQARTPGSTQVPELIVIDDADDTVIEITDLTKENETDAINKPTLNIIKHSNTAHAQKIQMPKAIDSIVNESDIPKADNVDSKGKAPEIDVASRIRTKAELKVMPPPQEHNSSRLNLKENDMSSESNKPGASNLPKLQPKSQKQHLFNQIREDNLRLESAVKTENECILPQIKSEPMNVDEIEQGTITIKKELITEDERVLNNESNKEEVDDDWANCCESFVEQLKTTACQKKKPRRLIKNLELGNNKQIRNGSGVEIVPQPSTSFVPSTPIVIKQEPVAEEEYNNPINDNLIMDPPCEENLVNKNNNTKRINNNNTNPINESSIPENVVIKTEKIDLIPPEAIKKEIDDSTDDDEPLIKSKLLKDKERSEKMKHQLLKDLSEKSAYVKLECCDVEINKKLKRDSNGVKDSAKNKSKIAPKSKGKTPDNNKNTSKVIQTSSTESDSDDPIITTRLRTRKNTKSEDNKPLSTIKTPTKSSPTKKQPVASTSTANASHLSIRKHGFGDGSDFHPGWEEELYRFKRSLRMPPRLIAIPRGRSGGPFSGPPGATFTRGSTSLPDLDTVPLSPAPSLAPSAATDDLISRRQDKNLLDSDLDSNSSYTAPNNRQYDSEATTSVFVPTTSKKKRESIIDVLIQKCSRLEECRKRENDEKNKTLPGSETKDCVKREPEATTSKCKDESDELIPLDQIKKENNIDINDSEAKKSEKGSRLKGKGKQRVENKPSTSAKDVLEDDDAPLIAATTSRTQNASEVERESKKDIELNKAKAKLKKLGKDKFRRRPSSIRDGLRSTSVKCNDARGRLLRLKKRNKMMNSKPIRKVREFSLKKKETKSPSLEEKESKEGSPSSVVTADGSRKRLKRLFGRRKFSSGFDYIRKKKKIIRKNAERKIRRIHRPSPESEQEIHKEIKSWFINKSVGETCLHRATRLGYTDCVAYCLEKLDFDPSSRDNAGFTPLHVAASRGHVLIGKLLLKYGANVSSAAQGGIRPLHEACENNHIEMIRLLLSYGADPLLGTYSGQTPTELADGVAAKLLELHISDVQGKSVEPWQFQSTADTIDWDERGCDPLSSPPPSTPPPPDASIEIQCTEAPLPPFYSLRANPGQQPIEGLWCLLQDITSLLQIKSKENLLKQIHCGSGSPKELLRELRTQDFLERAQCHQFLSAGEKVNVRASKVSLVRVTDKLRQLLKIETILVS